MHLSQARCHSLGVGEETNLVEPIFLLPRKDGMLLFVCHQMSALAIDLFSNQRMCCNHTRATYRAIKTEPLGPINVSLAKSLRSGSGVQKKCVKQSGINRFLENRQGIIRECLLGKGQRNSQSLLILAFAVSAEALKLLIGGNIRRRFDDDQGIICCGRIFTG